jgi:L,D-transpeptidase YcbB
MKSALETSGYLASRASTAYVRLAVDKLVTSCARPVVLTIHCGYGVFLMLRASLARLATGVSLGAILMVSPSLAQVATPVATDVVPPNAISMPTTGPAIDAPAAIAPAPVQAAPVQAAPEAPHLPAPAPTVVLEGPAPVVAQPTVTPAPAPVFSLAKEIDDRLKRERSTIAGDRADREAADRFYTARQGEPLWVTANGPTASAKALAAEIAAADAYALDSSAFRLPRVDGSSNDLADIEVTLTLAALKYARHARGGRMDPRQLSPFIDRPNQVLPPAEVLSGLAKAPAAATYLAGLNPQSKAFQALKTKLADVRAGRQRADVAIDPAEAAPTPPAKGSKAKRPQQAAPKGLTPLQLERKIIANMEMWRWLPDNLGDHHIVANVPEYQFRMVRGGQVVHEERMVVGKTQTPTPLFSETMKVLVFKPVWNVPNGIKVRDLLPQLARNRGALTKAGLKANYGGREIDPATVDFSTVDIRNLHIFQPSGPSNAMGRVKFLFPNKHDIYFHDTPLKPLFNNPVRTLSNGCMRVRDPMKFAELILAHDKGWDRARIEQYVSDRAADNQEVRLTQPVPVHITYFTAWVDQAGELKLVNDIYGHETRVHMGLEGKAHLIPKPQPPADAKAVFIERRPVPYASSKGGDDLGTWMKKLFNF